MYDWSAWLSGLLNNVYHRAIDSILDVINVVHSLTPVPKQIKTAPIPSASSTQKDHYRQGDFHNLIKKMMEIQRLLKEAEYDGEFKLPSIVVIGSQSSGKSSVLESLVGHEFLPKGSNMVTRRPLALHLVHAPEAQQDYAIFSSFKASSTGLAASTGPIYDFQYVQSILKQLNLNVPEAEGVSDDPIELTIYSQHIPDLQLIDLPGYIQVPTQHQPASLRDRIIHLCEKYIQAPNIILAVSSADVDIANSESLKASRQADPKGTRTIGVLTKMDLVDPSYGVKLLQNDDYPLPIGYIGVVCKRLLEPSLEMKENPNPGLLSSWTLSTISAPMMQKSHEEEYFGQYSEIFKDRAALIGMSNLRKTLTATLEKELSSQLDCLKMQLATELEDVEYRFKVQYNDQETSAISYISRLSDQLNQSFSTFLQRWSKSSLRSLVMKSLEGRLLDSYEKLCHDDAHAHPPIATDLTKSNVGRLVASQIVEQFEREIQEIVNKEPFLYHTKWVQQFIERVQASLKSKKNSVTLQIENALKPIKYGTDFTSREWTHARQLTIMMLQKRLDQTNASLAKIQKEIGLKRLKQMMKDAESAEDGKTIVDAYWLHRAKEADYLEERIKQLRHQLQHLQSDADCAAPSLATSSHDWRWWWGWWWPSREKRLDSNIVFEYDPQLDMEPVISHHPCQVKCPEVYLQLVLLKIVDITSTFLHDEFVKQFSVDGIQVSYINDVASFANENPSIKGQLKLQRRKEILRSILEKLSVFSSK